MPSAQLIEQIVRKVLEESGINLSSIHDSLRTPRPQVYILERQDKVDAVMLRQKLSGNACMAFMDEQVTAQDVIDMGCVRIILPKLSLKGTADLALGRAAGRVQGIALSLLMHGQRIEVLEFEHDNFEASAPPALFDMYKNYEKILDGFGLCRFSAGEGTSLIIRKRLMTESDMAQICAKGIKEILIAPGCLVTALAADMARQKGIRIITGSVAGKEEA